MIKISILYPKSDDTTFDMAYYCEQHMPMVQERCGGACKGIAVDAGLAGGAPGSPPPFVAVGHLLFESLESFQSSFGPHTAEIMADVPNYTNAAPTVLVSEIKL